MNKEEKYIHLLSSGHWDALPQEYNTKLTTYLQTSVYFGERGGGGGHLLVLSCVCLANE